MIQDKHFRVIGSILKCKKTEAFYLDIRPLNESDRMKLIEFLRMITEDMHNRLMQDMNLHNGENPEDEDF